MLADTIPKNLKRICKVIVEANAGARDQGVTSVKGSGCAISLFQDKVHEQNASSTLISVALPECIFFCCAQFGKGKRDQGQRGPCKVCVSSVSASAWPGFEDELMQ